MTMLIIWYFLTHKSSNGSGWIYVPAILMGLGANMKGLTAVGVPVFCILIMSFANWDWEWMPGMRTILTAALLSGTVFLVFPAAGCLLSSSWDPLHLAWNENVVRFFVPFDHKGPIYLYFYRIFDLGAPWSLLLPPALIYYFTSGRYREPEVRDTLLIFTAIFLFFTLSGSRRPYYLLPILPFASILIGELISGYIQHRLPYGIGIAIMIVGILVSLIFSVPFIIFLIEPHGLPEGIHAFFPWSIVLVIAAVSMILIFSCVITRV